MATLQFTIDSFEVAESGMFIIGRASYAKRGRIFASDKWKDMICFKSMALEGDNTEKGIIDLFRSKGMEHFLPPVVNNSLEVSVSADAEIPLESEPVIDTERVKAVGELLDHCLSHPALLKRTYSYELEE